MNEKCVVILVGPKGVGKTFLGRHCGLQRIAHFLAVEPIVIEAKAQARSKGEALAYQGFKGFAATESVLAEEFSQHDNVIIEMTGTYRHSDDFVESLRSQYRVVLVKVTADQALCLERIRTRSQQDQLPNSLEQIEDVYSKNKKLNWGWELVLENGRETVLPHLLETIALLLHSKESAELSPDA